MKNVKFSYSLKKYPIEVIRYVFYSFSSDFWVLIDKGKNKKSVVVNIESKNGKNIDLKKFSSIVKKEIEKELLRRKIIGKNLVFRENIIRKAINYIPPLQTDEEYSLTPEEQKELERLIKEAEEEIKKELKEGKEDEITKRWEEKYLRG